MKKALRMLIESFRPDDQVAMVVYAGTAGHVLPSTSGANQASIHGALPSTAPGPVLVTCQGAAIQPLAVCRVPRLRERHALHAMLLQILRWVLLDQTPNHLDAILGGSTAPGEVGDPIWVIPGAPTPSP